MTTEDTQDPDSSDSRDTAPIELEFLTDDESTRELCRKYWQLGDGERFEYTASSLAKAAHVLPGTLASRVGQSCIAVTRDHTCASCAAPRRLRSRDDYLKLRRHRVARAWSCPNCLDSERAETARAHERTVQLKRDVLFSALKDATVRGMRFDQTRVLEEVVYLVSLLRVAATEDFSSLRSLEDLTTPLSPTWELDREIVERLFGHGLICIHPESHPDSVTFEEGVLTAYYPFKVHWALPLDNSKAPELQKGLEEVLSVNGRAESWQAEAAELHRKIALHECIEYLRLKCRAHRFEPPVGDKTRLVLAAVLTKFSVAQAYNFIHRAVRDAAAFYLEKSTTLAHAANTLPGRIQRAAERAVAEKWAITPYGRDFDAPQTMVSQVLCTLMLQLPKGGFETVPVPQPAAPSESAGDVAPPSDDEKA